MAVDRQENNFDLIRLLAAAFVIFSHAFGICGLLDPVLKFTGTLPGGQLAVYVFFIISGYLIAGSWLKRPELAPFFEKRILRIFPALIVVLILSVFVFGPALTTLSLKEYFSNPKTYAYFENITLIKMQYALPGVMHDGKEMFFNYPLWTLFFEFLMYFSVAFFGIAGIFKDQSGKIWIIWILFLGLLSLDLYGIPKSLFVLKISAFNFTRFFVYFYSGVLYFYYLKNKKPNGILVLFFIAAAILTRGTWLFNLFSLLSITLLVFWLAFLEIKPFKFIVSKGDFSYGFYIYGSIIQNIIHMNFGCELPLIYKIPLSLALTFPFAFFSWKFIESKAMKLKLRV